MNRWSKYTVGHYSAIKKKAVLPTATRIDLEGIMLNERTQRKTDTMWADLYVKSPKNRTHRNRKQIDDCQKQRVRDGGNGKKGIILEYVRQRKSYMSIKIHYKATVIHK